MMKGFRIMKRKNVHICHSEEEMNKVADLLIKKGFMAEREVGVQPIPNYCIPVFKVIYWK